MKEIDTLLTSLSADGQSWDHYNLGQRPRTPKRLCGTGKGFRTGKSEHLRSMCEDGLSENFRMPRFHNNHSPGEMREILRCFQHERDRLTFRWAARVVHIKIDLIILSFGGNVLAVLAYKKSVQLKKLPHNCLANGHQSKRDCRITLSVTV